MQEHFNPSKLFKPWLDRENARRTAESNNQKRKRTWRGRRETSIKIGHGGTLDPMATGVLILGLGSGTKQLNHFTTNCNKTYETVVLFGAATDTYDTEGKVVSRKAFDSVTRNAVENALREFEGNIMQQPPIFSALKVQGKPLYQYAREGKEIPIEIQKRPVEVLRMEMLEWMEGGTHEWKWPEREADQLEKEVVDKVLHLEGNGEATSVEIKSQTTGVKRKRYDQPDESGESASQKHSKSISSLSELDGPKEEGYDPKPKSETKKPASTDELESTSNIETQNGKDTPPKDEANPPVREKCPAPACRLRMTVTSGFYVRSLCHDLGLAVGSLGTMASLVRQRQGEFELGVNTLSYDDLKQGEDVWGPIVQNMLEREEEMS